MLNQLKNRLIKSLRWSEQYTKTDMVYLASGGFWLSGANLLSMTSSFLSSIAFANLLPETTYGIYRYLMSTFTLLAIPTLSGLNTALVRAVAKGSAGSWLPAVKTKLKWGMLSSLASLTLAGYYYWQNNYQLTICFLITAMFLPLMETAYLYIAVLNGKKLFKLSAFYTALTRLLATAAIITATLLTNKVALLILVYFVSHSLLRIFFLGLVIKKIPSNSPSDPATIKFGKHLSFMGILGQISVYLDKLLIFHYSGAAALAVYYLALIPFKQIQSLLNNFNILALPKLTLIDSSALKQTLPKKILKSYLLIVPLIIVYWLASPLIFKLIYPKYLSSIFPSQLFILQLLLYPLTLCETALTAKGEQNKLYLASTSHAVIRIVLLLILVPTGGIFGAIGAVLSANLISQLLRLRLFWKMS